MKVSALALFTAILLISGSAYADEDDDNKSYPNSKCRFVISIDGTIQSDGSKTLDCMTQSGVGTEAAAYAFTQNNEQIVFAGPPAMSTGNSMMLSQVTIGDSQLAASGTCYGKFTGNMTCIASLKGQRGTIQAYSRTMGTAANPVPTNPEVPVPQPEAPKPSEFEDINALINDPHTVKLLRMTPTECTFNNGACKYVYYRNTDDNKTSIIFTGLGYDVLGLTGKLDESERKLNLDTVVLVLSLNAKPAYANGSGNCDISYTGKNIAKYICSSTVSNHTLQLNAEGPYIQLK